MGIKVILTMHGVVPRRIADTQFAKAFFIPRNPFLLAIGLVGLTALNCKIANVIVVHNNFAKNILCADYRVSLKKIWVIPHGIGVSNSKSIPTTPIRDKFILFFGNIRH